MTYVDKYSDRDFESSRGAVAWILEDPDYAAERKLKVKTARKKRVRHGR